MDSLNILDSGILVEKYGNIEEISKIFYGIAGKQNPKYKILKSLRLELEKIEIRIFSIIHNIVF